MDRVKSALTGKLIEELKIKLKTDDVNLVEYQIGIDTATGFYVMDITATVDKDIIKATMDLDLLAETEGKILRKLQIPNKSSFDKVMKIVLAIVELINSKPLASTNDELLKSLLELQYAEELSINKQKFKFKHYGVKDNAIVIVIEDNNEHNYMLTIEEFEKGINNNNITYKLKDRSEVEVKSEDLEEGDKDGTADK